MFCKGGCYRGRLPAAERIRRTVPADSWSDTESMGLCVARRGEPNHAEVAGDVHRCSRVELAMFDMIGPPLPIAAGSRDIRKLSPLRAAGQGGGFGPPSQRGNVRRGGGPRRAIEPQKNSFDPGTSSNP